MRWFEHAAVQNALAGQAWREIAAKKILVAQEDDTHDVYILRAGNVKVSYYGAGGKVTHIALMHAPDSFGELAALDGLPRSATVEAQTVCKFQILSAAQLNVLLDAHHDLSHLMMLELAGKVRNASKRLIDSQNFTVLERLAQDILQHVNDQGGYHVNLPQEVWAQTIGVSRETLARSLSYFEKEKIISRQGRDISVLDKQRLLGFAGLN